MSLPRNFDFAVDADQQSESLKVQWNNPSCTESGYIEHYAIKVCREDLCSKGEYIIKNMFVQMIAGIHITLLRMP